MATLVGPDGDVVWVGQFYAAMYWGFVLSTSFVGISFVQGYLYFTTNNKDRWSLKALVVFLLIFDPATSVLMAETIYYYFVLNFGHIAALRNIAVTWVVENQLTVLVTAMVQVFFATRVFLGKADFLRIAGFVLRNYDGPAVNDAVDVLPLGRTAPALVFMFALVAFVTGTVRTTLLAVWSVTSFSRGLYQTFTTIEESCALMSDLLASACLCYMLAPPRFDSTKQTETLKTMFMFTINRAVLMTVLQVGMLSSYLYAREQLYWMPFHLCKSKLYTNTLLAMLNSRSGGSFHPETPSRTPRSMPIINLTSKESAGTVGHSMFTSEGDVEKVAPSKENEVPGDSSTNPP